VKVACTSAMEGSKGLLKTALVTSNETSSLTRNGVGFALKAKFTTEAWAVTLRGKIHNHPTNTIRYHNLLLSACIVLYQKKTLLIKSKERAVFGQSPARAENKIVRFYLFCGLINNNRDQRQLQVTCFRLPVRYLHVEDLVQWNHDPSSRR